MLVRTLCLCPCLVCWQQWQWQQMRLLCFAKLASMLYTGPSEKRSSRAKGVGRVKDVKACCFQRRAYPEFLVAGVARACADCEIAEAHTDSAEAQQGEDREGQGKQATAAAPEKPHEQQAPAKKAQQGCCSVQ
eukprot:scaffold214298_cov19-Tisochrysis_lutea.AAC.1